MKGAETWETFPCSRCCVKDKGLGSEASTPSLPLAFPASLNKDDTYLTTMRWIFIPRPGAPRVSDQGQ